MSDIKNKKSPESTTIVTPNASISVEMTQKINFNYKEVVSEDISKTTFVPASKENDKGFTHLFSKKHLFVKKSMPDDYVKSSPVACIISSISALEKELKIQDINDNYILKQQIAEGAQGIVMTGFDKSLKRNIIVKSTKPDNNQAHALKDKNFFVSEARIMAQLDHPSIAPIYGMFSDSENKLHLTMKHIHGKTMKDYLQGICVLYQRDGVEKYAEKDSILNRIEYLIRVCEAVDYAHCKGVIHRDLKPENIIIGSHGEIYVMDWGLACLLAPEESPGSQHLTEIGLHLRCELAGTPCYIAPELIRGGLTSPQSDIFSLGMILFEIVTLTRAVPGNTIDEVFRNILKRNYNPFRHRFLKIKLSDDLNAIIAKATSPALSRRYETANDMAKDLRSYLMRKETMARPDNFIRKCLRGIGNHAMITSSVILSSLLLLTVIALYGLHSQNILINKQKTREAILTNFQYELLKRSDKLNYAIRYFENQLTNLANHSKHILTAKGNTVNTDHIYSLSYSGSTIPEVSVKNMIGKSMNLRDRKKMVLSEMLKRMMFVSNLKFKDYTERTTGQADATREKPVVGVFIGLKNGSILAYYGDGSNSKNCCPAKRAFYNEALKKNDAVSWSKPFKCTACSKIVISCLRRIMDKENKVLGVAGIDIDLEYIHKYLFLHNIPGMKEFLVNKSGEVILSSSLNYEDSKTDPETKALVLKKFSFKKEFQTALARKRLQFKVRKYNREYIFGISHIPSLDCYYIEQMSERKLWEDHKKHVH